MHFSFAAVGRGVGAMLTVVSLTTLADAQEKAGPTFKPNAPLASVGNATYRMSVSDR